MHNIGKTFINKLIANKLIIFSLLLIVSYTYIIRDDYIAADAYIEPSDNYVFVTCENPAEMKINVFGDKMNSILFSIQHPEISSDVGTMIDLYEEDEMIASISLSNNDYYEITDTLGNAVELLWSGGGKN